MLLETINIDGGYLPLVKAAAIPAQQLQEVVMVKGKTVAKE